ncbi:MAG: hypothetical protein IIU93_02475, partial [Alistipes sp.]|nr:hypothetical protein [Alistipes sp.]
KRMASYYNALYSKFNRERFNNLTETFGLDPEANLNTFSKGMRRRRICSRRCRDSSATATHVVRVT